MDEKNAELALLKEQLAGCETDLIAYQHHGGDPAREANYRHKLAQAERLRARIAELEQTP